MFASTRQPPNPFSLPLLVTLILSFKEKSRLMQQHASRRGNGSVSPPLQGVFMTGPEFFSCVLV